MEKRLNELISTCVLKNVIFQGQIGTGHTVQDLVHAVSLRTIDTMWKNTKKELGSLETDSLSSKKSSSSARKKNELELKKETLEAIYSYKEAKEEEAKDRAKKREDSRKRLDALKEIQLKKEYEEMEGKDKKSVDSEISKLEEELANS